MGCCSSTEAALDDARAVKGLTKSHRDKDGSAYKDGSNSTSNNVNTKNTSSLAKDHSGASHGQSSGGFNKEVSGGLRDRDEEDDADLNSDNASVSSRRSMVSVTSTRSSKALATGQNNAIPKSQDALMALARNSAMKNGGADNYVSPSAKGLDLRSLKSATAAHTNTAGTGIYGSEGASTASPTSQTEGTLEAARNEMSMFVWGDYNVDPLDAIEQRNARYGGGKSAKKTPKKHLGSSLNSVVGGVQFVLNDFVIKTMDEEMIDAENFKPAVVHEEFFGDRPLRNSSCRCMLGHGARVKAIAVSPDEATFVSSSVEDNDILQQFVSGRGELFYFTGHGAAIVSLSFSRDGHYFASTSRDASIAVWDAQQGTVHKRVRWLDADCGGGGSIPIANAFSFNGQYICAGYQDRVCRVWDLDRNAVMTHFTEHEGIVICVSCHPSELICASGGADRNVFLWKLESGDVVFKCSGHDNAVISVNFTPNGESLISSDDKSCKIWNVQTGKLQLTVHVADIVTSMPTVANSNRVVATTNNNSIMSTQNGTINSGAGPKFEATQKPSPSQLASLMNTNNNSTNQKQGAVQEPDTSLPGSTVPYSASSTVAANGGSQTPQTTKENNTESYADRLPPALRNALSGRNSLATARKAFQSTAAISQRMAFTVSCPCPGSFSTGYFAVASTAKSVHIISMTTGKEETSFAAKAPVFALACGREEVLMFGDTFGNLYVADLK